MSLSIARTLATHEPVLLLLDGLDELSDYPLEPSGVKPEGEVIEATVTDKTEAWKYRLDFMRLVSQFGSMPVIVTSRISDYETIVRRAGVKIRFRTPQNNRLKNSPDQRF